MDLHVGPDRLLRSFSDQELPEQKLPSAEPYNIFIYTVFAVVKIFCIVIINDLLEFSIYLPFNLFCLENSIYCLHVSAHITKYVSTQTFS